MKKKNLKLFFLILNIMLYSQQNDKEVYEKYLRNGAYKYSYYRPEYQIYIDSALALLPKSAFLWQQKAMPYFKRKKYEIGMIYLDEAVKFDDEFDKYLSYRAFIKCIFQKNYQGAIDDLDILLNNNSNEVIMDHTFYFYKALSLIQLNKYDEAEMNINKSMTFSLSHKFDPHYLELFYIGIIFYEKEQFEKALEYFDKSLKVYPNFSDALFYKGETYYFMHKNEKALECFIKSKENFDKGYTINEDNAFYEEYPYQIKKWMIKNYFDILEYQNK